MNDRKQPVIVTSRELPPMFTDALGQLAEVRLGVDTQMSEERFVELTKEVLGADARYHNAMYEIMGQVVSETTPAQEASSDGYIDRSEGSRGGEGVETSGRIPA